MKKVFLIVLVIPIALLVSASNSYGQGAVKTGPTSAVLRDADLEKDSLHNLEVARHYFKLKKAYVAAIKRCEEIDAGNPNFAKMDEVLFIAGESSLRLAENSRRWRSGRRSRPTSFRIYRMAFRLRQTQQSRLQVGTCLFLFGFQI